MNYAVKINDFLYKWFLKKSVKLGKPGRWEKLHDRRGIKEPSLRGGTTKQPLNYAL
jgi:hypothetical protein